MIRLSILVPALTSRPWRLVVDELRRQADAHPGEVEVRELVDNGEATSGAKRQRLLVESCGDYVAFVDDDDQVADDYVSSLLAGAATDPDVVTFDLLALHPSRSPQTWRFGLQDDQRRAGLMCANHLCAWRRDLARSVAWCPELGYGDDQLWYKPLAASLDGQGTEVHVDRPLYRYQFHPDTTVNQGQARIQRSRKYFGRGLRAWRDQGTGGIWIELGDGRGPVERRLIRMRDRDNRVETRRLDGLTQITLARLA